jgi:hypothetical protein
LVAGRGAPGPGDYLARARDDLTLVTDENRDRDLAGQLGTAAAGMLIRLLLLIATSGIRDDAGGLWPRGQPRRREGTRRRASTKEVGEVPLTESVRWTVLEQGLKITKR